MHDYRFEARAAGAPTFEPLIVGTFVGASSSRGSGAVLLDFEAFRRAGVDDAMTPHGAMAITYDRASDPVTIELSITNEAFNVVRFDYAFVGFRAGHGAFDYAFRSNGDLLEVKTRYDAAGAGRNAVAFTAAAGAQGSFQQCWDAAACLTFVEDVAGFTCGPAPCSRGAESACVTPPIPPFY